jgi:hypothetical protein
MPEGSRLSAEEIFENVAEFTRNSEKYEEGEFPTANDLNRSALTPNPQSFYNRFSDMRKAKEAYDYWFSSGRLPEWYRKKEEVREKIHELRRQ